MPNKAEKLKAASTDGGKSISTQISDLRLENRELRKLHHAQQAQIAEQGKRIDELHKKIGI